MPIYVVGLLLVCGFASANNDCFQHFVYSPNRLVALSGDTVASAGMREEALVWNRFQSEGPARISPGKAGTKPAQNLFFSADGTQLFWNGGLFLSAFDVQSWQGTWEIGHRLSEPYIAAALPNGQVLGISEGRDNYLVDSWDGRTGESHTVFDVDRGEVPVALLKSSLRVHPSGKWFAFTLSMYGQKSENDYSWKFPPQIVIGRIKNSRVRLFSGEIDEKPPGGKMDFDVHPTQDKVIVVLSDRKLVEYQVSEDSVVPLRTLSVDPQFRQAASKVRYSPDGKWILTEHAGSTTVGVMDHDTGTLWSQLDFRVSGEEESRSLVIGRERYPTSVAVDNLILSPDGVLGVGIFRAGVVLVPPTLWGRQGQQKIPIGWPKEGAPVRAIFRTAD